MPKHQPELSICIPAYRQSESIHACIDSALAAADPRVEILVVDDRSPDQTFQIAEGFRARGVRCVQNTINLGAVGNHNRCLDLASADHVILLHGDDRLEPGGASTLRTTVRDSQIVLGFGRRRIELVGDDADHVAWAARYERLEQRMIEVVGARGEGTLSAGEIVRLAGSDVVRFHVAAELTANCIGEPSNVIIDRRLALRLGGFRSQVRHGFDIDMWLRMLMCGDAAFVNDMVAVRRMHADTLTVANHLTNQHWLDRDWTLDALVAAGFSSPSSADVRCLRRRLLLRAIRSMTSGGAGPRRASLGRLAHFLRASEASLVSPEWVEAVRRGRGSARRGV